MYDFFPLRNARIAMAVKFNKPLKHPIAIKLLALCSENLLYIGNIFAPKEHHFKNAESFGIPDQRWLFTQLHSLTPLPCLFVKWDERQEYINPPSSEFNLAIAMLG